MDDRTEPLPIALPDPRENVLGHYGYQTNRCVCKLKRQQFRTQSLDSHRVLLLHVSTLPLQQLRSGNADSPTHGSEPCTERTSGCGETTLLQTPCPCLSSELSSLLSSLSHQGHHRCWQPQHVPQVSLFQAIICQHHPFVVRHSHRLQEQRGNRIKHLQPLSSHYIMQSSMATG